MACPFSPDPAQALPFQMEVSLVVHAGRCVWFVLILPMAPFSRSVPSTILSSCAVFKKSKSKIPLLVRTGWYWMKVEDDI